MFTNRSVLTSGIGTNQAYGADAAFSFFDNLSMGGFYARTETTGFGTDDDSYQARFNYDADRYGARLDYTKVGQDFNPEVGFLRRQDFRRSAIDVRFSPRPQRPGRVRQYTYEGSFEHIENHAGHLESQGATGHFNMEFANSDQLSFDANVNHEGPTAPFSVTRGVSIAAGDYDFNDVSFRYQGGQQRRVSGTVTIQAGQFYDGTIRALTVSGARASLSRQLSVEPSVSINHVELPANEFTTQVLRARSDFAFTPRMFGSGLVQYSSSDRTFSSNLRFRWEYRPGSEFFLVYTDERDTSAPLLSGLRNKALVVKVNRLWQF
jgi:hypothetical protein